MSKITVNFGMEFEFMSYKDNYKFDPTIYSLPNNWLHCKEYYVGMQEFITNPKKFTKRNFLKNLRDFIKTVKKVSKDNSCKIPLHSVLDIRYEGIISNGIHIHFSFYDNETNLLKGIDNVSTSVLIMAISKLLKYNLIGIRSLYSHHIYGYLVESNYSFKYNQRFMPVIISPKKDRKPKTIEIRLFDLETILQPNELYKCIKEIKNELLRWVVMSEFYYFNSKYNILAKNILDSPIKTIEDNISNYESATNDFNDLDLKVLDNVLDNKLKSKAYVFENGNLTTAGSLYSKIPSVFK